MLGPALAQQRRHIERAPDVPARHDVGEGVVVDMLVILVRPDDAADMAATVRLQLSAARPEPARLQQDLGAGVEQEPFIRRSPASIARPRRRRPR